ncbi:MAG: heavy metal translocating P-type ATPase [Candidatus Melainabacteria bacterium]|nr:heavy metal translocating P-type ATPase [Candidatus Melainabacteria bacterium]
MCVARHTAGVTLSKRKRSKSQATVVPATATLPVEIAHTAPGRLRLRIARLYYDDAFATGIRGYLLSLSSITSVRVTRQSASIVIEFDKLKISSQEIIGTVSSAPLSAILSYASNAQVAQPQLPAKADSSSRLPLYLATAGAILSLFTMPLISLWAYPLVALISIPVFQRAWNVVTRQRRLNVDFLDALSVIAAIATGDVRNAAIIVWLITLADYIRDLTKARSHRAIDELLEYEKALAWVVKDGIKIQIPATQIVVGDTVVVYTGSRIPVDGTVVSETATVDQQVLTGESLPVLKQESDKVFAGTTVSEGRLYLRAEKVGANTKAATIVKLVESAPVHETRAQNYAEKVADGLVTPSLVGAVVASAATASISRFAAIVTVDFGTGIRVSAPTSVLSSMAACAKNGVLIKGGAYLEKLSQVSVIIFDKTGTLTHGIPEVEEIIRHNGICEHEALALAAAAANRQTHPVSQAVCRKAESLLIEIPTRESLNFRVGRGLEAKINGYTVHLGSNRFMSELGVDSLLPKSHEHQFFSQGNSLLYLAVDGSHAATLAYRDKVRQESAEVVSALRSRGINDLIMLTGDHPQIASRVSEQLGLTNYYANMLPEDKAAIVQEFQSQGKVVAVIGDGINDSPALSYADIGISICSGAEISRELAGVVLMTEDLHKLVHAIDASREAMGLIKQNTAITMGTNALAYFGAALGLLNPVVSTLISNGSAVLACLNGLRPALRKT